MLLCICIEAYAQGIKINQEFWTDAARDNDGSKGQNPTPAQQENDFRIKASGNVGIGTINPNASAALHIESTMGGFLFPRLTTVQRNAIRLPAKGLIIYNLTKDCLDTNTGTPDNPAWKCDKGANAPPINLIDINGQSNRVCIGDVAGEVTRITARASDPEGDPLTYSLETNPGGRFAINADTGVITSARQMGTNDLGNYSVSVKATSSGGSISKNFNIEVKNKTREMLESINFSHNAGGWTSFGANYLNNNGWFFGHFRSNGRSGLGKFYNRGSISKTFATVPGRRYTVSGVAENHSHQSWCDFIFFCDGVNWNRYFISLQAVDGVWTPNVNLPTFIARDRHALQYTQQVLPRNRNYSITFTAKSNKTTIVWMWDEAHGTADLRRGTGIKITGTRLQSATLICD